MQFADITYWSTKYTIYNEISSVDYLCELSGAAAGLYCSLGDPSTKCHDWHLPECTCQEIKIKMHYNHTQYMHPKRNI